MKDRLVTLGGAVLALVFVVGMFSGSPPQQGEQSGPGSTDGQERGYYAAREWLTRQGIDTLALRHRYNNLDELDAPRSGNLLIINWPQVMPMRPRESDALKNWTRQGNTVLLARHSNAGFAVESALFEALEVKPALAVDVQGGEAAAQTEPADPETNTLPPNIQPVAEHPILDGVAKVVVDEAFNIAARSDLTWTDSGAAAIPLMHDLSAEQPVLLAAVGAGGNRVWLLRHGEIFSNASIGSADNARLWMNLVRLSLRDGGAVIFDDMHQGDSALYDPAAFYRDPRLYTSLGFLLLIWLFWLLGYNNRLATPRRDKNVPSQSDYIRAVGRFYARRMRNPDAASEIFTRFFNNIRRINRQPVNGSACWNLLTPQRAPRADPRDVARLRELQGDVSNIVDLQELHNLTRKIKESLT